MPVKRAATTSRDWENGKSTKNQNPKKKQWKQKKQMLGQSLQRHRWRTHFKKRRENISNQKHSRGQQNIQTDQRIDTVKRQITIRVRLVSVCVCVHQSFCCCRLLFFAGRSVGSQGTEPTQPAFQSRARGATAEENKGKPTPGAG